MRSKQSTMNCTFPSWKKQGDKEKEKRIILSPNPKMLRCVIEMLDAKCQVDFNADDSLCKDLGFNKKIYKAGRHESENLVNMLSINSILVHCDIIEASRLNRIEAPVIFTIYFQTCHPGTRMSALRCIWSTSHQH